MSCVRPNLRSCIQCLAVLLLCIAAASATADELLQSPQRSLLQAVIGNANGCLGTIPKCEPGACINRDVNGVARWVCQRCLANYAPVVDANNNILQCVCPRGAFEASSNATTCDRCPVNTFCPGGDNVESPLTRGRSVTCGTGLVTRSTGSRSQADCVSPAGYAQTAPNLATPCNRSEYAPAYNRLARCIKCQSGLQEPPTSTLTDGARDTKRTVCMLPPGKYMSQGLVRLCPQGFYREGWVPFDAANGTLCLPCRPGITTDGSGAPNATMCNKVLPGYGLAAVNNVTGPASIPALPTNTSNGGLPQAYLCDFGYYSLSGYCAQCPSATTTRTKGARAVEECSVPPGYYIETRNATMTTCPNGRFRENWVMYSDGRALSCTWCGDGIASDPKDFDEHPKATNGSLVRATPSSCFINPGQGMISQGYNLFMGQDCPEDTYGAAGRTFGWFAAPCKPCPRNMITDGLKLQVNATSCINDDGFGYSSEGSSKCAPGFYSAKGSLRPCKACPAGRTTMDDPTLQANITHCVVMPGYGVVNSTANSTDAFNIDTSNMTLLAQAGLAVAPCPVGYFGPGNTTGATCQQCPCGSTTLLTGAASAADCNVCLAGYGKVNLTDTWCQPCPFGSFQPGGLLQCQSCPNTAFYAPVDGKDATVTSGSTSLFDSAVSAEACVPWQSQLSPEAGQAYFSRENTAVQALLSVTNATNLAACFAACPNNTCCLMQYEAANKTCRIGSLSPVAFNTIGTAGMQLMYKLPPSAMGSASSVEPAQLSAKTIASGYYAACAIPAASAPTWQTAGTNLGADARTFALGAAAWDTTSGSIAGCQRRCDTSNVCWGFFYNTTSRACLYRGGVDALATRSFFVMPPTGMQGNSSQTCPGLPNMNTAASSLPSLACTPACGGGLQCVGGQCACPNTNLTLCGVNASSCMNTAVDRNNCGVCGNVCPGNFQCLNGICAESQVACNTAKTYSGNMGTFTYSITIGTKGPNFVFAFDGYSFPDRFNVLLPNGTRIFTRMAGDPGKPSPSCTCGSCMNEETFANGQVTLPRPVGVSSVQVVVNGYCPGTVWQFNVGCAK